ncbi:protein kinase domain-containing protein [Gordonia humi]|uniref:non-specific serine/threonine protein kinase n=1 Tax=Gordonia humi TaxID=686429 RepID=A0A840F5R7_9ACTN|nr:serine/threonine-protein kinase [Gordonia humi]
MEFTEIAGYRIIRRLGAGGMGQVFLVEHPRLPRRDALKLLDAGVSRSDDFKTRFQREADILAQFSHPNIVMLYDRGEVDDRLWITMEYVEGTDAGALVADRGPLDAGTVLTLVGGAGAALDYAWRKRRVTHRDVKPENILIGFDDDGIESVKLADFGIAKAAGVATSLTSTGTTVGTMLYVSPEAIEGRDLDDRADLYSLGCTAFHLLTGRPPFSGSSVTALLAAHLHRTPPRASEANTHLSPSVDALFAKVLAKDPEARYDSCGEFVDDLARALRGEPISAFASTVIAPHRTMDPRPVTKNTTLIAAVTAIAVLLVVGVAVALGVYVAGGDDRAPVAAAPSTTQWASVTKTVTATAESTTRTTTQEEPTWTPDETTTTQAVVEPYEGMPCDPSEFGDRSADGTLGCSGLEGSWVDLTNQDHETVEFGAPCAEPGVRARVTATERIVTCRIAASGGSYSWQD